MDSIFARAKPYPEKVEYTDEQVRMFRNIDFLLTNGWKFLGNFWNGKQYEIVLQNIASGDKLSPSELRFISDRSYWLASDADGKLF